MYLGRTIMNFTATTFTIGAAMTLFSNWAFGSALS